MMLALQANAGQCTGSDHSYLLTDTLRLCEESFSILMRHDQWQSNSVALRVSVQLLEIIVSPAHPDSISRHDIIDESLKRLRCDGEQWCVIDFVLGC